MYSLTAGRTVIMSILRLHSLYVISVSKDVSWDNVGASTWCEFSCLSGSTTPYPFSTR